MIRFGLVKTIVKKELRETLRDRRTLLIMVGLPVLLYPLLMLSFSSTQAARVKARQAKSSTVAIWGDAPMPAVAALSQQGKIVFRPQAGFDDAAQAAVASLPPPRPQADPERSGLPDAIAAPARALIAKNEADAILIVWPGFEQRLAQGRVGQLSILFDSVATGSRQARDRLQDGIDILIRESRQRREAQRGLPRGFSRTLDVRLENVAPPQRRSGQFFGTILPFIIIVLSLMGGFYPSIDLTAGEKERGTMQTLLCAPLRPSEIIFGKFLAVWVISLVAGAANLVSLAATLSRIAPPDLEITARALVLTFLLYAPVSFITSAVFLAVGVFAKDFKDGQNFVTPVYMVLVLPVGLTVMPDVILSPATAFAPILNVALLIKALMIGSVQPGLVFLVLISTALYAALALAGAVRVFARKQILLGGTEPIGDTLGFRLRAGRPPTPGFALTLFAVMLVVAFYGSLALKGLDLLQTLLASQALFILAPVVIATALCAFPLRETFGFRRPPLLGLLASLLIGASAWTIVMGLVVRVIPPPPELIRGLSGLAFPDLPLWQLLILIAVIPPVCEELTFRGVIYSGLKRLGHRWAIVGAAICFGIFHLSLWRMLPTVFLGLFLGLVMWRTGSIWCAILVHAANNGVAMVLTRQSEDGAATMTALPWSWTGLGVALLVVGTVILFRCTPPDEMPPDTTPPVGEGLAPSRADEVPAPSDPTGGDP